MMNKTNNGKQGGLIVGESHENGGVKAVVTDTNVAVELENGEAIIKKEAVEKHHELLSKINQESGGAQIVPLGHKTESKGYILTIYHSEGKEEIDSLDKQGVQDFLNTHKKQICTVTSDGVDVTRKFGLQPVLKQLETNPDADKLNSQKEIAKIMIKFTKGKERDIWLKILKV